MNAQEIINDVRRRSWTQPGQVTFYCEFDQGSLVDQLWEEQGFYASKGNGVLVSMRKVPEYHEDFYEFECMEILDGEVQYWKSRDKESVHVDPKHYEMMLEKRDEVKIDFPMMFTEPQDSWRWGVEEHPECEHTLRFFYQQATDDKPWETKTFESLISLEVWRRIKKAAKIFFTLCDEEIKNPDDLYMGVSFQIFEHDYSYCIMVREDGECEECLEICFQEREKEGLRVKESLAGAFNAEDWSEKEGLRVKESLAGAFNAEDWKRFEAMVDAFIAEHFA